LDPSAPQGTESISEGDNHIRVIKNAVKKTFPQLDGEVTWKPSDFARVLTYVNDPPYIPNPNPEPDAQAASCKWDGSTLMYEHNVLKVTMAGPNEDNPAGVRITFKNLISGFDSHYAIALQPFATSGRHIVTTITNQQSNFVEFTSIEYDGASATWNQPNGGVITNGFSFIMIDTTE
jgi:hypothetical protein